MITEIVQTCTGGWLTKIHLWSSLIERDNKPLNKQKNSYNIPSVILFHIIKSSVIIVCIYSISELFKSHAKLGKEKPLFFIAHYLLHNNCQLNGSSATNLDWFLLLFCNRIQEIEFLKIRNKSKLGKRILVDVYKALLMEMLYIVNI